LCRASTSFGKQNPARAGIFVFVIAGLDPAIHAEPQIVMDHRVKPGGDEASRMPSSGWSLHPQLEHDTVPVGDLALCRVLAMNDADYPWLILVPRRPGVTELIDLSAADAARLMEEIAQASRVLKAVTRCDKLNIAAIGNVVPQLHVHIVARRRDDPLWPKLVWGHISPRAGDPENFARFMAAIREGLSLEASL
jgi:diadenosine tetraphosphate (Ap4A) HIT family hydrolase